MSSGTGAEVLEEARLPVEQAALLLAVADGLCAIGELRTGERAGQFSIFNFLLRCAAEEGADGDQADEPAHVLLMRAGILRRHAWWMRYRLPAGDAPLRLELPGTLDKGWDWLPAVEEIAERLRRSEAWQEACGASVDSRVSWFAAALREAEVKRTEPR